MATFTSTSDFLINAVPGDVYKEESGTRTESTLRFVERLTDHPLQRRDAVGGLVEDITTSHSPSRAEYRTVAVVAPLFTRSSSGSVTHILSAGDPELTIDVAPGAKRMHRSTLRRVHASAAAAYLTQQEAAAV